VRARLLRSSLVAAAVGVLLVGVPVLVLAGVQEARRTAADLQQRADALVVLAAGGSTAEQLRSQVTSVLTGGDRSQVLHAVVTRPDGVVEVGPAPTGAQLQRTAVEGPVSVSVTVPRASLEHQIESYVLAVAALSALAFLLAGLTAIVQARRLARPLADLADNADRIGRGESRLKAVRSGVAELDRVAAGLARSAESMAAALAAEREFASDASHQLRTPLTALSMRLEEIASGTEPVQMREEAGVALTQVERLTSVVDSLLARARHTHRSSWEVLELGPVLRQQMQEWTPAFRSAHRALVLAPVEPVRVRATPGALSQVLATLVENSLRHGRGTATITARRTGGSVVVEVTDDGPGIPAHLGSRVFERTVSSSGSTGLGLALARDLAEADGGRLELVRARPPVFALFLNVAG
jgi:signal transduction histidine kinase